MRRKSTLRVIYFAFCCNYYSFSFHIFEMSYSGSVVTSYSAQFFSYEMIFIHTWLYVMCLLPRNINFRCIHIHIRIYFRVSDIRHTYFAYRSSFHL